MSDAKMQILTAHELLRDAMLRRMHSKMLVGWFTADGVLYGAEPRDDKYPGAWLVKHRCWESFCSEERLASMIFDAEGFPIELLLEAP